MKNSDYIHNGEGENKYYTVDFIEGPTDVRYSTIGETDFNKNPYSIQFKLLEKEEGKNLTYEKFSEKKKVDSSNNIGHWALIYESDNENATFLPQLIEYEIINNKRQKKENNFINPLLQPPGVYFEDTPIYGVKYILDYNILFNEDNNTGEISVTYSSGNIIESGQNAETRYYIKKGTVLWSQPIYSYQDNYPSTTLNKWNGKDIIAEEETGIITANGFSAGKKERDNTFTGVILGDWSRSDTDAMITKQTGIYGFNHGAMSYALKDDGTAFFGKDGKGRIYFNGNNAQIYSADWTEPLTRDNNLYAQSHSGMLLDINDGLIDIRNSTGGFIKIKSKNNDVGIDVQGTNHNYTLIKPGLLEISVDNNTTKKILLEVSTDNYYLQSKNFSSNSEQGVKFDLRSGKLTGYNFKIQAGSGYDKIIISSDSSEKPLKIGNNKFYVDWDGKLFASEAEVKGKIEATSGTIGNWQILNDRLQTTDGSVYLSTSTWNFKNNFIVNSNGYLTAREANISGTISTGNLSATGGTIGNWNINSGAISNGATTLQAGGKLYSTNADISGTITATSGKIGGWKIESAQLESTSGDTILYNSGKAKFGYTSIENTGKIAVGDYVTLENVATNGSSGGITVKNISAGNSHLEIRGSSIYFYNASNELTSTISDSGLKARNSEITNLTGNGVDVHNIDCANIVVHGYIYDINSTNQTYMRLIPIYHAGNTVTWECLPLDEDDIPTP